MMSKKTDDKLKYQVIFDEFLKSREWTDKYEIDVEKKAVTLITGINFSGGKSGRLIIEASDETDCVDVFIYFNLSCKEAKINEMAVLLNGIHCRWRFGLFTVFPDGIIRWSHRVDFEGSQPTGLSVDRIVQPGWDAASRFSDIIAAVALTRQSAADALTEYDNAE